MPQNYKSHVEDDSAKLVVNTDKRRNSGSVERMIQGFPCHRGRSWSELLDRIITNAFFFSEAKTLYHMIVIMRKTKDEIKNSGWTKEDVATETDPYNCWTDDDGNYV